MHVHVSGYTHLLICTSGGWWEKLSEDRVIVMLDRNKQSQTCGFHMLEVFDTFHLFQSSQYNEPTLIYTLLSHRQTHGRGVGMGGPMGAPTGSKKLFSF